MFEKLYLYALFRSSLGVPVAPKHLFNFIYEYKTWSNGLGMGKNVRDHSAHEGKHCDISNWKKADSLLTFAIIFLLDVLAFNFQAGTS